MLHPKRLDDEASSSEMWKNPLTSMQKRLAIADSRVRYVDKLQSYSEEAHALWQRKHDYVVGVWRSSETGTYK